MLKIEQIKIMNKKSDLSKIERRVRKVKPERRVTRVKKFHPRYPDLMSAG